MTCATQSSIGTNYTWSFLDKVTQIGSLIEIWYIHKEPCYIARGLLSLSSGKEGQGWIEECDVKCTLHSFCAACQRPNCRRQTSLLHKLLKRFHWHFFVWCEMSKGNWRIRDPRLCTGSRVREDLWSEEQWELWCISQGLRRIVVHLRQSGIQRLIGTWRVGKCNGDWLLFGWMDADPCLGDRRKSFYHLAVKTMLGRMEINVLQVV